MKEQNTDDEKKRDARYDYATHRLRDADGYAISGQSEFTRDRSDPYEMVDFMIDRDVALREESGETDVRAVSEEEICDSVRDSLARSSDLDASGIEVRVTGEIVTLAGSVRSERDAHLAEILSQDLPGVREVKNQLHYKL